jgi:signal transduction histidine kinase/DNA-binding NarL/FixJ family response regulator/HPt (histidine-containing phosphotransfer) domain-containing protein
MRSRLGSALGQIAIVIAALVLISLAWLGSFSAITAERDQTEARVEAAVGVEALAFEEQVSRQLLALDQTLRFLRREQQANPGGFDLSAWRAQATLLNDVSGTLFLVDENGKIRGASGPPPATVPGDIPAGSVPGGLLGVGPIVASPIDVDVSGTSMFRTLLAETEATDRMFVGSTTEGQLAPGWHIDLALRLLHPDGSFAGAIGIALPTSALGRLFREAHLRPDDMIAVVGTADARLRAEIGPVPVRPDVDIGDSAMLQMMREMPDGEWIGPSAPDGIERIHAFHHVPDQDLEVVVGVERNAALAAATTWARGGRFFAGAITALVVLMALLLLREARAARRRSTALGKKHANLAASNAELAAAKTRADAKTVQLEATLAGMTDGVAMVDASHSLMEWNDLFPEISGVPAEVLRIGTSMEEMVRAQAEVGEFGPVDIEAEVARRMQLLHSGRQSEISERARPNGRIIELRRNYLPDGGMVTLYTDITARKQVENALRVARAAAEEASAAKARFVAIVSHEIRTPLNALLNSLQLLGEAELTPSRRVLVELARQAGDALLALVSDILDMSRLEAGQLALRRSVFALRPVLTGVLEMLRPLAARRGITLRLAAGEAMPHLLFTDPARLRQVLLNLLSNAAKYAAPGEVLLIAESIEIDGGPHLRLAVRDQGPAISEVERARLFQPFSQLDQPSQSGQPGQSEQTGQSAAEVQPGSGLGLAICRLLATLAGGAVGCETIELSPMGQPRRAGNEFWMTLPIDPLPPDADMPAYQLQTVLPVVPHSRILLVEDVTPSRIVVARLLRRAGHMVDTVVSGEAAIAAVSRRPYDAVLMDVHMPGMSGIDAARQIRMLSGPAGAVPVIALTAATSAEETAQCRAAGINGRVTKPASLVQLLDAIGRHAWPGRVAPAPALATAGEPLPAGEPPASKSGVPVLAAARLEELRRHLAPDILGKLVEGSLLDLQQRLPALRDALGAGDARAILMAAHAMAGVAGSYGMAALDARLRAVMDAAHHRNNTAAMLLAEDLESDVAQAAAALRESLHIELV